MADVLEKGPLPKTASTADRDAGRTGTSRAGDDEAATSRPPVLSRLDFRVIGYTLNGEHWQADVAKLTGISRSQVTRYLNGEREMSPMTGQHMQFVVVERIAALAKVMDRPGMPYAGSPELQEAIQTILTAVGTVPGKEPPRK